MQWRWRVKSQNQMPVMHQKKASRQRCARAHEVGIIADVIEGAVLDFDAVQTAAAALSRGRLLPIRQPVPERRALQRAARLSILPGRQGQRVTCRNIYTSVSVTCPLGQEQTLQPIGLHMKLVGWRVSFFIHQSISPRLVIRTEALKAMSQGIQLGFPGTLPGRTHPSQPAWRWCLA